MTSLTSSISCWPPAPESAKSSRYATATSTCWPASPALPSSGTLVYVKGQGLFRQPWTKTDAGYRTIFLPSFAVQMLLSRLSGAATKNRHDAVFCTRRGTWLSPNNVRRQWREARTNTGLEWVIPHTFRKTVATLLDREADTKSAAAQLGHATEETTNTYYIEKPQQAPDVSHVLQNLAPQPDPSSRPNKSRRQPRAA